MTILDILGYTLSKPKSELDLFYTIFFLYVKNQFKHDVQIIRFDMERKFILMNYITNLVLFHKLLVLKLLKKMLLLRGNINTFLMLLATCYFNLDYLRLIGYMLLLMQFF